MSSSNQRPANRGFRSVFRCAISHYRQSPLAVCTRPPRVLSLARLGQKVELIESSRSVEVRAHRSAAADSGAMKKGTLRNKISRGPRRRPRKRYKGEADRDGGAGVGQWNPCGRNGSEAGRVRANGLRLEEAVAGQSDAAGRAVKMYGRLKSKRFRAANRL